MTSYSDQMLSSSKMQHKGPSQILKTFKYVKSHTWSQWSFFFFCNSNTNWQLWLYECSQITFESFGAEKTFQNFSYNFRRLEIKSYGLPSWYLSVTVNHCVSSHFGEMKVIQHEDEMFSLNQPAQWWGRVLKAKDIIGHFEHGNERRKCSRCLWELKSRTKCRLNP